MAEVTVILTGEELRDLLQHDEFDEPLPMAARNKFRAALLTVSDLEKADRQRPLFERPPLQQEEPPE